MKRHSTRKMLTAHRRGEHQGYNIRFTERGCPLCADDLDGVFAGWEDALAAGAHDPRPRRMDWAVTSTSDAARATVDGGNGPDTAVGS